MTEKKIDLNRPTGTRDFAPRDLKRFRVVENIVKNALESQGFEEIQTPTFEFLDLFLIRSGEKFMNDVFTFTSPSRGSIEDKDMDGDDSKTFVLRPEFTAPVCRFFIQNDISQEPKPIRIYYKGPCYRYDKPAPGRYREFFQVGVEVFGINSAACDADIIIVADQVVNELCISDYIIRINDLNLLRGLLSDFEINRVTEDKIIGAMDKANGDMIKHKLGLIDNTEENIVENLQGELERLEINGELIRILKEMLFLSGKWKEIRPKVEKTFNNRKKALDAIEASPLEEVEKFLSASGISSFIIDLSVARGLDYYTGIVFEIDSPSLGKQKQICGGGRYDRLIEEFGGESTPATGFAFGLDRLVLAAEEHGFFSTLDQYSRSDVFLYAFTPEMQTDILQYRKLLLKEGIRVEVNVADWKVKRALQFASKLGFTFALMLGETEAREGKVMLKNLKTGQQDLVDIIEAITIMKKVLVKG